MRVPVLTYHSINIRGTDYADNDLVAFGEDLEHLNRAGWRVVPLGWITDQLLGRATRDLTRCVALTCDDGTALDHDNLVHPTAGPQVSIFNRLRAFRARHGAGVQPDLHMTSFVIASPRARQAIDTKAILGQDWMRDDWWAAASASGLMAIENHSWDHNHPNCDWPGIDGMPRGHFGAVDNAVRAAYEIELAADYIDARVPGTRTRQFCYPFGHVPPYVRDEWLPTHADRLGIDGAWADGARPVEPTSHRFELPRYICGWHWKSPAELDRLLADAA
jgi:hypothetical protein